MNVPVLFAVGKYVSEFLKKSGSFALSSLNSGIIVRLSILMFPDNVTSNMLVPKPPAETAFLSSKYSPLNVNPNGVHGS